MPVQPTVKWHPFSGGDCLKTALGLKAQPLADDTQSFMQLRYIERYANDIGCQCFAVESPYIDRDYIEDHSAFYAKNLYPYPNSCRRVHFFSDDVDFVQGKLRDAIASGTATGIEAYRDACEAISNDCYLGFSVIKPLAGTPVGRTVMKCFPPQSDDGTYHRHFSCTRDYSVHFGGCELSVNGLAFQQQDIGVSACATTALWSALQKTADDEPIASMTPVQITQLATKYSLPSGRPMPSEGLELGQMCSAVQASGVSPNVFRVKGDHRRARILLRSAINSGFAPVLAMFHQDMGGHAVTAVGLKEFVSATGLPVHFHEHCITGLYIHDDRLGPNLRCDFRVPTTPNESLGLDIALRDSSKTENWELGYILVPLHPKIRLSFANLQQICGRLIPVLRGIHAHLDLAAHHIACEPIGFDCRIVRGHRYLEGLIVEGNGIDAAHVERIGQAISPARYLGVIRVEGPFFSRFDVIADTTGTMSNPHFLGVIPTQQGPDVLKAIGQLIARMLDCPFVA